MSTNGDSGWSCEDEGSEEDAQASVTLESSHVCVVCAQVRCARCRERMPVVCLYCPCGVIDGESLEHITVQHLYALDAQLAAQLQRWPDYRLDTQSGCWLNHCQRCRAPCEDQRLHSEPGQPFFDLPDALTDGAGAAGPSYALTLTPLRGRVWVRGDYSLAL